MPFSWKQEYQLIFAETGKFAVNLEFDSKETVVEFCSILEESLARNQTGFLDKHIFNGSIGVSFFPYDGLYWKITFGLGNHGAGLDTTFYVPRIELDDLVKITRELLN
jgi:hypothetical protein